MTKVFYFTIGGRPVGKERPRKGKYGNFYTPLRTVGYEEKIRTCFRELYPKLNDGDHRWRLELWINPQGVTVRATQLGKNEPVLAGADGDNVAKVVADALQGLVWANDKQIAEWHIVMEVK